MLVHVGAPASPAIAQMPFHELLYPCHFLRALGFGPSLPFSPSIDMSRNGRPIKASRLRLLSKRNSASFVERMNCEWCAHKGEAAAC
jgi:hypothetical protein